MYLVTAAEMQAIDKRTMVSFGIPGRVLMENAGRGATRILMERYGDLSRRKVGVLAGPGNNGGDGFVIARCLAQHNIAVSVFLASASGRVSGDAGANLSLLESLGVPVVEIPDQESFVRHVTSMKCQEVWVDALLGTGLKSDVKKYFRDLIGFVNDQHQWVFSVDIPSGLDADTGFPRGISVRADSTATFGHVKIGHTIYPGADLSGHVDLVDIGIPEQITRKIAPRHYLLTPDGISSGFNRRDQGAHKGTCGHLLVVAGSRGKSGAAVMTSVAAMRSGTGLVTLGIPESLNGVVESQAMEVMTVPLAESTAGSIGSGAFDSIMTLLSGKGCLAMGPGMGVSEEITDVVLRIVETCGLPLVVDADGLNCLASHMDVFRGLTNPVILTPHPGEMAGLLETTADVVQADRVGCARHLAETFQIHVVLKGARTVIAHPDGRVFINPTGNPGMASGGMGDILTGLIAGFITQGYSPEFAAHAGVYLHGAAADTLARDHGPQGFLASEVMARLPAEMKILIDSRPMNNPVPRKFFY
jgi:ADP-dependent NAD(P)H-hydrate dehydratase / NAD(P)H-hydrate epimerase